MLLYVLALVGFCFILERSVPGWKLPHVKTWPFRVIVVNLVQLGIVWVAGFTWERWLSAASVFHMQRVLSPAAGGTGILHRNICFLLVASLAA
jgi:hypothetical protein